MDIPEALKRAEQEIIDDARNPKRRALRRALGRERRGQQVVAVVTAAASLPLGGAGAAGGAHASAASDVVAVSTVLNGHGDGAPIVLTAAEQPAAPQSGKISDAQWRAALIHSARHQMALNPSRAGAWGEVGEGDNGPQCAEGQSVIVDGAENLTGQHWVFNPRVAVYGEQQTWVIWRVSGDGSWRQWAINHGRWHPAGDGYTPRAGDLGIYGDPGYHIVMMGGDGTVYGMDDSSDLGNHHRDAGGGFSGYIDMSLPSNLAASGAQANPSAGQPAHRKAPKPVQQTAPAQSTQAQSAVLQSDNVPGGLAAPVGGNGGTAQSSSATPLITPPVVTGGIAAPVFQVGTVGYADQFHADQPQQQSAQPASQPKAPAPKKAAQPVRRYTRHNPPPAVRARIPGTADQQKFIRSVIPGAIAAQHRWGVPASVTIAQAITESGWGQSGLAARDHNLFGIKGSGPAGTDNLPTQEYQNGQYVTITAPFRVYNNIGQSINDHGHLLATSGYYGRALSAWANNHSNAGADNFADDLTGVYATDPHYGSTLKTTMGKFNLYQFNKAQAPAQSAPASAPRSAPKPGAGANLGRTGQQPQPQQPSVPNDAPGGVAVPGALAVGGTATTEPAQAGGLSAPGLPGNAALAAQVNGSSSSADIQLVADVSPMPWLDPVPQARQSGPSVPGNRMPWVSAPSAAPRNGNASQAPVPRAPQAPVQATLMAAHQTAAPQSGPPARSATSVDLAGAAPLHPRYGAKYIKSFKADAEDGANRAMYRAVSAATGVPWQIVATLALLRRPRGTEVLTLEQLVRRFARQAWETARVNVTGGRLTPRQLDAAYQAYGAKSQDGLRPSELTRLITVPLQGTKSM